MSNHPNRSRGGETYPSPAPEVIKAAREEAGLKLREAAAIVSVTMKTWQNYEAPAGAASHRRMPAGLWELFQIKLAGRCAPADEAASRSTAQGNDGPQRGGRSYGSPVM